MATAWKKVQPRSKCKKSLFYIQLDQHTEVPRNSGARRPVLELDAVSGENSRGKFQNVVVNSTAKD
jgi:hypothetical protein